ncbi:MAG: hypothetical protein ABIO02_04685 [Patescibacteria group bacterium]
MKEGELPRTVEISFGTLFKVSEKSAKRADRVDVVLNIGEENIFCSAPLEKDEEGNNMFPFTRAGSAHPGIMTGEIVGQLSLDEVIEACRKGTKAIFHTELPENIRNSLLEYSKLGSRTLLLE